MSQDLEVFVKISGKDAITPEYRKINASSLKLARNTQRNFKKMNRSAMSFKKLVGGITFGNLATRGLMQMERGVAAVATEVVDLDQSLTAAAAKFGGAVRRGTDEFKAMNDAAREVGATTQFTASEAAKGIDFLAMAGFNYEQSLAAIVPLTDLATSAQMDLARASDIASDSLGAFGLMVDSPEQLATNLKRVNDVFAKTVTTSNTTMETLFETMQESGPAIKATGAEIETFAALAGKLGSAGIKGSKAGTTLKNMFLRMAGPVGKAKTLMKKLGIEAVDPLTGDMKDMIDILDQVNKATADMGTGQRAAALDVLFSKRAISGVNVLLDEGTDSLKAYKKDMDNAMGSSADMAAEMRKGLGTQLKILKSTLTEKGLDIFSKLMGEEDPAEAVGKLSDAIRELDITEFANDLKTLLTTLAGVAKWGWENREMLLSLGKAWLTFRTGMGIASLISGIDGLTNSMSNFASTTGSAAANSSKLSGILSSGGLVVGAAGFGLAIGGMITDAMARTEKRQLEQSNRRYLLDQDIATVTTTEGVEDLRQKTLKEFDLTVKDVEGVTGRKGLDVDMDKDFREGTLQDKLQKLQKMENDIRTQDFVGGQGRFALPGEEDEFDRLTGFSGGLGQTENVVKIDEDFRIDVNFSGLPEGVTANPTVTKAPPVNRGALGVSG